jgi:hypothetical protein
VRSPLRSWSTGLARLGAAALLVWVCGAGTCVVAYSVKTEKPPEDEQDDPHGQPALRAVGLVLELGEDGAAPRALVFAPRR